MLATKEYVFLKFKIVVIFVQSRFPIMRSHTKYTDSVLRAVRKFEKYNRLLAFYVPSTFFNSFYFNVSIYTGVVYGSWNWNKDPHVDGKFRAIKYISENATDQKQLIGI